MNEHIKDRLRQHTGKLLIGATGTLLALSVLTLGSSLVGDSPAASDTRPDALVQRLKSDLDKAQAELRTQHAALLNQLPGVDVERVDRDTATGRSLLLSLTDSSASTRTVKEQQALLDARYGCLDHESRVLTEFVPEWMTATGAVQGSGTTYTLAGLDIDVSRVQGLDYSFTGVARLDPVRVGADRNSTAKSEFVVFTYATSQDGTVTLLDAYRASSRTRDALAAADKDRPAEPGSTAASSPKPTG
ncbi:hypothetical protein [Streptomyces sp. NBC_00439]|uniref:hypothetical protein n=1 Tax=Streptomyces sp. NBC_00439 TaxID=2903650 RepID=UPI002252E351|nr:hypothetical protein [Streptomyces sp. NBC_00439]MCX5103419.1 hypothetical protein [Streptomyces sp. NBC_00439]